MKSVPVDIHHLEDAFYVDLDQFEDGKTDLMAKLFDAAGLLKGHHNTPPGAMR